jgi:thymidine phosphorylase
MAWGGHVRLSPADDILIRVERVLDLDSPEQMVASILSKKAAAGSTHVVIDMPIGPTAKVHEEDADQLTQRLYDVAGPIGLNLDVIHNDGLQPVGRGIGPALEAKDVLSVLANDNDAPQDLRDRSLSLTGPLLDLSETFDEGQGRQRAEEILDSRRAEEKFKAICHAQGGLYEPPTADFTHPVEPHRSGTIQRIDNRRLARAAKLAGAPDDAEAGVVIENRLGDKVQEGDTLFTVHADNAGELSYALDFIESRDPIYKIRD